MREDCRFRGSDGWCELMFHKPKDLKRMCPICIDYEPSVETVMSWLEGLTQDTWREFHSDSEVQNIAKYALELLKEHQKTKVIFMPHDGVYQTECSNCGTYLDKAYSRCPKCQKELDWNSCQT